jgi:hypothetical protein
MGTVFVESILPDDTSLSDDDEEHENSRSPCGSSDDEDVSLNIYEKIKKLKDHFRTTHGWSTASMMSRQSVFMGSFNSISRNK